MSWDRGAAPEYNSDAARVVIALPNNDRVGTGVILNSRSLVLHRMLLLHSPVSVFLGPDIGGFCRRSA
jgi:hypothetical protein